MSSLVQRSERKQTAVVEFGVLALATAVLVYTISSLPVPLTDWKILYRTPLADPYSNSGFMNPYWTNFLLEPFRSFGVNYGFAVFITAVIGFIIYVFRDNKPLIFASLVSPYFLHNIINGQIDGLIIVGYWLLLNDNVFGTPLMLMKPQVMLGSVATWFLKTSRKNKVISVVITTTLVSIGFILYGNWIMQMAHNAKTAVSGGWNIAFNLPIVGVVIFIIGVWRKNLFISGLGTLFITPYVAMHSLWVYWTAWLMEKPNYKWVLLSAVLNWVVAIVLT